MELPGGVQASAASGLQQALVETGRRELEISRLVVKIAELEARINAADLEENLEPLEAEKRRCLDELDHLQALIRRLGALNAVETSVPQTTSSADATFALNAEDIHILKDSNEHGVATVTARKRRRLDQQTQSRARGVIIDRLDDFSLDDFEVRLGKRSATLLMENGTSIDQYCTNLSEFQIVDHSLQDDAQYVDNIDIPSCIESALFPHQKVGVSFLWQLYREGMGGLLADEMGLGKTIQIIALVAALFVNGELCADGRRPAIAKAGQCESVVDLSECGAELLLGREEALRLKDFAATIWSLQLKPVLIVCPATLLVQWRDEFYKFYPLLHVVILHGPGRTEASDRMTRLKKRVLRGGVFLTSYEAIRIRPKFFRDIEWKYVILDEGQKIRNPDALVTQAVKRLRIQHRLLLSGSPIQNDLKEFWSLFDFIAPGKLGTLPVFNEHFAEPITRSGVSRGSASNALRSRQCVSLLRSLVGPHMLRRTKKELLREENPGGPLALPSKDEQIIVCPLTLAQYQIYADFLIAHNVEANVSSALLNAQRRTTRRRRAKRDETSLQTKSLWYISVLSKICNHPDLLLLQVDQDRWPEDVGSPSRSGKLLVLRDVLKAWKVAGHKALVFSQTIQVLDIIQSMVVEDNYSFLRLDGMSPIPSRLQTVQQFNSDKAIDLMLLTTRVGGLGLNLVGATRVVIFDPDWNPTVDAQAQERAWRIGQNKDVVVYRLLTRGTLEEKIYKRQIFKYFLSERVLADNHIHRVFKANDFLDLFSFPPPPKEVENALQSNQLPQRLRAVFTKACARQSVHTLTSSSDRTRHLLNVARAAQAPRMASQPISEPASRAEPQSSDPLPAMSAEEGEVSASDLASPAKSVSCESSTEHESEEDEPSMKRDEEATEEGENLLKLLFSSDRVDTVQAHSQLLKEATDRGDSKATVSYAQTAMTALRASEKNRRAFGFDVPTWTGKSGLAGRPSDALAEARAIVGGQQLKEVGSLWSFNELRERLGATECWDPQWSTKSLTSGEQHIIEKVFDFFYGRRKEGWQAPTGNVLMTFGPLCKTDRQKQLLKSVLTKVCDKLHQQQPVEWKLKVECQKELRARAVTAFGAVLEKSASPEEEGGVKEEEEWM